VAVVLCSGSDKSLLETRRLILERAGHTVVTVSDEPSLLEACKKHSFDVAIVGQSVPTKLKPRLATLIRQHCPNAKILELFPPHTGKQLEDADSWLIVPADVPRDLVERVNELASKGKRGERKEA
jgi:CheY-like chemotaxis protein